MSDLTRRDILCLSIVPMSLSSGCVVADYPPHRVLSFRKVDRLEDRSPVVYEVVPKSSAAGRDDEWGVFHGVRVVAFGADGLEVGSVGLGDVVANEEHDPVELVCENAPVLMTFTAAEGPCDEGVELKIARVRREDGAERWQVTGTRECGEGLPPKPLTSTS